jgi:hypothetical protein
VPRIQQIAAKYDLSAEEIGETIPERLEISLNGRPVISTSVTALRAVYEGALEQALRTEVEPLAAD